MKRKTSIWSNAKEKQIEASKKITPLDNNLTKKLDLSVEVDADVMNKKIKTKEKKSKSKKELVDDFIEEKVSKLDEKKVKKVSKRKLKSLSPTNRKGWKLIVVILIIMVLIVLLPIAFIFATGSSLIYGGKSLYVSNGFITENKTQSYSKTTFSLEHISSGKYIDFPTSNINNEFPLTLSEDPNNYNFVFDGDDLQNPQQNKNLSLKLAFQPFYLVAGEKPILAKAPTVGNKANWEKKIKIGLHKEGANDKYTIYSKSHRMFLGNPDANEQILWSSKPVWWKLRAKEKIIGNRGSFAIKTPQQFETEFWDQEYLINNRKYVDGLEGRTLSIQSVTTGNFLNTSDFVGEFYDDEINKIKFKQSSRNIKTSNRENFNFFVHNVLQNRIQLGSFVNNTVDIRKEPVLPKSAADWFPVLVANGNKVKLETKSNALNEWDSWTDSFITLEKHPLNLRQFAIIFSESDTGASNKKYLSTRSGKATIDEVSSTDQLTYIPEYFRFNTSSINTESLSAKVIRTSKSSAIYNVSKLPTLGKDNVYKLKFRARAFNTDPNIGNNPRLIDDSKWRNYKLIGNSSSVRLNKLRNNTEYNHVEMKLVRDNDSARHVTTYLVDPFVTKEWKLPGWEWPDWDWPDIPDPGDEVAENISLKEKELKLEDNPGNNVTALLDFRQGTGANRVFKIEVSAYELDSNLKKVGPPKKREKFAPKTGVLQFNFGDLKPETSYWFTTKYTTNIPDNNYERDDSGGIPERSPNGAASGIYSMTVKTHRLLPEGEIKSAVFKEKNNKSNIEVKLLLQMSTVHYKELFDPPDEFTVLIEKSNKEPVETNSLKISKSIWKDNEYPPLSIGYPFYKQGDKMTIKFKINMKDYGTDPEIYIPEGTDNFIVHSLVDIIL